MIVYTTVDKIVRKMTQIPVNECYFLHFTITFVKIIATQNTQKNLSSLNAGGLSKKLKISINWSNDIRGKMFMQTPLVHQPDLSTFGLLTVE